MKLSIRIAFLLLLISCGASRVEKNLQGPEHPEGWITEADYNLLFVGNSLTYTHNLPGLVKEEASKENIILNTYTLAKPNYAIVDHWAEGTVREVAQKYDFDFIIIQQGPSSLEDGREMLINGGKKYVDLCTSTGSQLAYFMVWPSRSRFHAFQAVIDNYKAGAEANNALILPVGEVWKKYIDETEDFSYYGPDQFHPSLKGSKVAAAVIVEYLLY